MSWLFYVALYFAVALPLACLVGTLLRRRGAGR
jgi:hypothetical protein